MSDEAAPRDGSEETPVGVQPLDHTADIGILVWAPTLEELFIRAGRGSLWMAVGPRSWPKRESEAGEARRAGSSGDGPGEEEREVVLEEEDLAGLLRSWCRELLYWAEVENYLAMEVKGLTIHEGRLTVRVAGLETPEHPLREIKGVTWHGLEVGTRDGGWHARIIYDV